MTRTTLASALAVAAAGLSAAAPAGPTEAELAAVAALHESCYFRRADEAGRPITGVQFKPGSRLDVKAAEALLELKEMSQLSLWKARVDRGAMKVLKAHPKLVSIELTEQSDRNFFAELPAGPPVREVVVHSTPLGPTDFRELGAAPSLKRLQYSAVDKKLAEAALKGVEGMKNLEELVWPGAAPPAEWLNRMGRLRAVGLDRVTAEQMAAVAGMKELRSLRLTGTGRPAGFERVGALAQLTELDVRFPVTDADLAAVGKLTKLERLRLNCEKATPEGMKSLAGLTGLTALELHARRVDGALLGPLTGLPALTSLTLEESFGGAGGFAPLGSFAGLERLRVRPGRSRAGGLAEEVVKLTRLKWLDLGGGDVRDADVRALAGLKGLEWLKLPNADPLPEAQEALKAALPNLHVDANFPAMYSPAHFYWPQFQKK
jgi:hypothetical protein